MVRTKHACARIWIVLLAGCQGIVGDEGATATTRPPPPTFEEGAVDFECAGYDLAESVPLRRLSRRQLERTVGDSLARLLGDAGPEVAAELVPVLAALPADLRQEHESQPGQLLFFRSDTSIGASSVDAHYKLGIALGRALSTDERLGQMGFECATDDDSGNDAACLDELVRVIGRVTHRRPLDTEEFAFFRNEAFDGDDSADRAAVRDLISVMFTQPYFLFHVEGTGELTPFEAASRLSYHFWDTMPDEALFAAAESGELMTAPGWQREVERVIADDRVESSVRSFLTEWLRFDQLNVASSGSGADFDAVVGDIALDAGFDEAVQEEIVSLFLHVMRTGGSFEDFFLSEITTTDHPVLAQLYGVEPSDGAPVELPAERRGILSRVGLLLARAEVALPNINSITHPILRGVFVRRQILCDTLPSPPGGAMDGLPDIDRSTSGSREVTEQLTGSAACAGCHTAINSTGYALEAFDAIGQFRAEELLFDTDGAPTVSVDVDDSVTIPESESPIRGAAELAQTLFDSEKVGACFTRHYARFVLERSERPDLDGCMLQTVDESVDAGQPLSEVLSLAVLQSNFRVRGDN